MESYFPNMFPSSPNIGQVPMHLHVSCNSLLELCFFLVHYPTLLTSPSILQLSLQISSLLLPFASSYLLQTLETQYLTSILVWFSFFFQVSYFISCWYNNSFFSYAQLLFVFFFSAAVASPAPLILFS